MNEHPRVRDLLRGPPIALAEGMDIRRAVQVLLETVSPDLALLDLAQRFVGAPYRRFPVVEEGRLIGLVGRRDVLRAIHELPTWRGP